MYFKFLNRNIKPQLLPVSGAKFVFSAKFK